MRKSLRLPQYFLFFTLILGFKTLKAIDKPPLAVPSRDSLERSVANKSMWDIFAEANKHTYTNINLALAYANIALEKALVGRQGAAGNHKPGRRAIEPVGVPDDK